MLDIEMIKNFSVILVPVLTAVLTGITKHSTNKLVQNQGTYVILRGYGRFNEATGEERKQKAVKYFQELAMRYLPVGIRELVVMWLKVWGSKEVQKAYDDYWEAENKERAERYQWNGNVEPSEGVYYE